MAYVIKHETIIPEVYMCIGEISTVSDMIYNLRGWICSTKYSIEDILVGLKDMLMRLKEYPIQRFMQDNLKY